MAEMMDKLSSRERQIMDIVFEVGEASAAAIRERLPDAPSSSAVRTMLTRMVAKGYLLQSREENRYIYTAAETKDAVQSSVLSKMLNTFFEGSVSRAVSGLLGLSSHKLSEKEREDLKRIIDQAKRGEQ